MPELAAVLAHEIGHYKKKHILKMFLLIGGADAAGLLHPQPAAGLARFVPGFLAGIAQRAERADRASASSRRRFTFWVGPLFNLLLRRHEYEADAYAAAQAGGAEPMQAALLKIYAKNLAAPLPHLAYSAYHYSHPTLLERLKALESCRKTMEPPVRPGSPLPPGNRD